MSSSWVMIATESLVAVLLVLTISYCVILNQKLKKLKSDETMLKATIVELVTATDIAERAISTLKSTVGDCDKALSNKLGEAKDLLEGLDGRIRDGGTVVQQIGQIVSATKPAVERPIDIPSSSVPVVGAPVTSSVLPKLGGASAAAAAARALTQRVEALARGEAA